MKFGSVRFFKRLIIAGYILLILLPLAAAVALGFLYTKEKNRADALQKATLAEISALLQQNGVGEDTPLDLAGLEDLSPQVPSTPSLSYQTLYPQLYAQRPLLQTAEENLCYLTFDDGPSATTTRILEVLAEKNIKATFFVTGKNSELHEDALRAIAAAGHTIGVHSFSHEYKTIYASVENYLADFELMYNRILEVTGQAPTVFRFPGGSINAYNLQTYTQIVAEMTRRGFVFYDWNAAGDDAVKGGISRQQVVNNVMQSASGNKRLIVLLHDRTENGSTAEALPGIIDGLEKRGFSFAALQNDVQPITYYYTNTPSDQ